MADLTIVFWRDIPAQVIAKRGRRDQVKLVLNERFEKAIDRAAMRGGARSTDDYLAEWRKSDPVEIGDDLESEARKVAEKLETEFDADRLDRLVSNGGFEPAAG